MTELMAGQYNASPSQRRTAQELPSELLQQTERLRRLLRDTLPAVQQALRASGAMK